MGAPINAVTHAGRETSSGGAVGALASEIAAAACAIDAAISLVPSSTAGSICSAANCARAVSRSSSVCSIVLGLRATHPPYADCAARQRNLATSGSPCPHPAAPKVKQKEVVQ